MFMVDEHPLPWLAPLLNGVEHANFFETRATEYSKAATRGNWNEVWDNFDRRQNAKPVAAANEDTQEGGLLVKSGVAEAHGAPRPDGHAMTAISILELGRVRRAGDRSMALAQAWALARHTAACGSPRIWVAAHP